MAVVEHLPGSGLPRALGRRGARPWRRQTLISAAASAALHAAAALAALSLGGLVLPAVSVSQAGRNSIALLASLQQVGPADSPGMPRDPPPLGLPTSGPSARPLPMVANVDRSPPMTAEAVPYVPPEEPLAARSETATALARAQGSGPDAAAGEPQRPRLPRARVAADSPPSAASLAASGAEVDQLPRPIFNPSPAYPPEALRRRLTGRVVLAVSVDAAGQVTAAEVHNSSGHAILDRAAAAAVRQWRFEPARRGGVPVAHTIAAPVNFVLAPDISPR